MSDVLPARSIVFGTINTVQAFFGLMIARASGTKIIVRREQCTIRETDYTGAAKISPGSLRLIFDFAPIHDDPRVNVI